MAAATVLIAAVQTTDAQFTAWAQNISSHFASAGMTAVANNINWATIATPTAAVQKRGWEIWSFADAFQSTSPVFVRIDYGSGTATANPGIWLQLGSGANTAAAANGMLTGPVSNPNMGDTNNLNIGGATTQANTENCYFAGNTNYISTWMWMNKDAGVGVTLPIGFSLERTKDQNGNDTGQGILVTAYAAGVFYQTVWDCFLGQLYPHETSLGTFMPAAGNGTFGSNVAVYPIFHSFGNSFLNPGLNIMTYFNADLPNNTTQTVSVYGSNHTYITAEKQGIVQNFRNANTALLLRYE